MELQPGSELAQYRLLGRIGEGGMGVVWRALDTSLGRDVAVKVLPAAFASDPERMARFEREARVLASLNHPHIAAIYGVGAVDGVRFLAMELVEGDDLAQRLTRGAMAPTETIEMAIGLAEALEAAHEKGVVHRDLKPANLKLGPDGEVKVLDFGLAKALDPSAPASSGSNLSMSPTITSPMTAANVILGTAAYMSPEQARGRAVDRRADIWAFGCVLYECLTAQRPFPGETVSDTIAKILEREPDWNALPANTPPRLRALLKRCLEKDPRRRLRDIGDARYELEETLTPNATEIDATSADPKRRGANAPAFVLGLLAVALGAASVFVPLPWRKSPKLPVTRIAIDAMQGDDQVLLTAASSCVSPDGSRLTFCVRDSAGLGRLYVRELDSFDAHPLTAPQNSPSEEAQPFWSPDGRSIGYNADGKLYVQDIAGGAPRALCNIDNLRGATWNAKGVILLSPSGHGPLSRIAASGGELVQETQLDTLQHENAQRFPHFLPDGEHYTYVSMPGKEGRFETILGKLGSKERRVLIRATSGALFVEPGVMVWRQGNQIVAQRIDTRTWRLTGSPAHIGETLATDDMLGAVPASASRNGVLVYPTAPSKPSRFALYGVDGHLERMLPFPPADYEEFVVSPDGLHLAVTKSTSTSASQIWVGDLTSSALSQLTNDESTKHSIHWSGDSKRIVFASQLGSRYDFFETPINGTGTQTPVLVTESATKNFDAVTADDSLLIYDDIGLKTQRDIYYIAKHGPQEPRLFAGSPFDETVAIVSPDGHHIVYASNESGQFLASLQSFPVPGARLQIPSGPLQPFYGFFWNRDGSRLLLDALGGFFIYPILPGPELRVGAPVGPIQLPREALGNTPTPDLQHFVVSLPAGPRVPVRLAVVTNWTSLLDR